MWSLSSTFLSNNFLSCRAVAFGQILRINDNIVLLNRRILLTVEVYEEHEQREEEPNEHAGCAEIAATWLSDALSDGRAFVLKRLFQLTHSFLCVLFSITNIAFEFVECLSLLLHQFV